MNTSNRYASVLRSDLFAGQVHWVTGGGSGIGRCVAHELAALGATVIVSGRKPEKLDAVVAEITHDGGKAEAVVCDIRDEDAVKATVTEVIGRHGQIHGLVNNAGGQFPAPLMGISKKGFDAVVGNNLTGGFLMMREVFVQSMQQHGGAIVNMTADFKNGMPGMAHSGAARAGMSNLTATAAFEWGWANVRVNAVAPGWVASSGMDTYEGAFRTFIPKLKQHVPLGRLATESEVSSVICFLLSPGASFISGITVQIDGAASLGSAIFPRQGAVRQTPYNGFHRAVTPDVLKDD
jgi:citronellol/citronellal dehydrogenase